jgi:hypothetical protein
MRPCYVAPGFDFLLKMLCDGIIRLAYADADSDTVSGAPSLTPGQGRGSLVDFLCTRVETPHFNESSAKTRNPTPAETAGVEHTKIQHRTWVCDPPRHPSAIGGKRQWSFIQIGWSARNLLKPYSVRRVAGTSRSRFLTGREISR